MANDTNGDGVLELAEFRTLIVKLIPEDAELDDRQISELYNEVGVCLCFPTWHFRPFRIFVLNLVLNAGVRGG